MVLRNFGLIDSLSIGWMFDVRLIYEKFTECGGHVYSLSIQEVEDHSFEACLCYIQNILKKFY